MTHYTDQDLQDFVSILDINQQAFRISGTTDYDWFDQSIRIDTDCIVRIPFAHLYNLLISLKGSTR